MHTSKKMRLISEDEYNRLKSNEKQPVFLDDSTYKNEQIPSEMTSFLDNPTIPDDIKIRMYSHIMKQATNKIDKYLDVPLNVKIKKNESEITSEKEPMKLAPVSSVLNEHDIALADTFPGETNKEKAKTVMELLKRHNDKISWNSTGGVRFFNQPIEPGTSIVDLISYLIRNLKKNHPPIGINRFLFICKTIHLPITLVNKELRREWSQPIAFMKKRKNLSQSGDELDAIHRLWVPLNKDDAFMEDDPFEDSSGNNSPYKTDYTNTLTPSVMRGQNQSTNGDYL